MAVVFGELEPPLALCYVHEIRGGELAERFWNRFYDYGLPTARFMNVENFLYRKHYYEKMGNGNIYAEGNVALPDPVEGRCEDEYYFRSDFSCQTAWTEGRIYPGDKKYAKRKVGELREFRKALHRSEVRNILFGGVSIGECLAYVVRNYFWGFKPWLLLDLIDEERYTVEIGRNSGIVGVAHAKKILDRGLEEFYDEKVHKFLGIF